MLFCTIKYWAKRIKNTLFISKGKLKNRQPSFSIWDLLNPITRVWLTCQKFSIFSFRRNDTSLTLYPENIYLDVSVNYEIIVLLWIVNGIDDNFNTLHVLLCQNFPTKFPLKKMLTSSQCTIQMSKCFMLFRELK